MKCYMQHREYIADAFSESCKADAIIIECVDRQQMKCTVTHKLYRHIVWCGPFPTYMAITTITTMVVIVMNSCRNAHDSDKLFQVLPHLLPTNYEGR